MWENIIAIHSILKEKNYKAKFLTSSIIKLTKIIFKKKNKKEKKRKVIHWVKKKWKKKKKKWKQNERNALWITIVIDNEMGAGEQWIPRTF
jgi:hypothetical protein